MKPGKLKEGMMIPKDPGFFKDLFEEYYPQLVRFAEGLVYDHAEATDIVMDVFHQLWEKAGHLVISTSLSGYLFTAVRNSALNHIQSRNIIDKNRDMVRDAFLSACHTEPETDEELLTIVNTQISNMPEQMGKIIRLRIHENMKYSEIATHLNLSINTVKTHLRLAFRLLRDKLTGWLLLF